MTGLSKGQIMFDDLKLEGNTSDIGPAVPPTATAGADYWSEHEPNFEGERKGHVHIFKSGDSSVQKADAARTELSIADMMISPRMAQAEHDRQIAAELAAKGGPVADGFNYGDGWPQAKDHPVYLHGEEVRMGLQVLAHEWGLKLQEMNEALRNMRLAETHTQRQHALAQVAKLGNEAIQSADVRAALHVNSIEKTLANDGMLIDIPATTERGMRRLFSAITAIRKRLATTDS